MHAECQRLEGMVVQLRMWVLLVVHVRQKALVLVPVGERRRWFVQRNLRLFVRRRRWHRRWRGRSRGRPIVWLSVRAMNRLVLVLRLWWQTVQEFRCFATVYDRNSVLRESIASTTAQLLLLQ